MRKGSWSDRGFWRHGDEWLAADETEGCLSAKHRRGYAKRTRRVWLWRVETSERSNEGCVPFALSERAITNKIGTDTKGFAAVVIEAELLTRYRRD